MQFTTVDRSPEGVIKQLFPTPFAICGGEGSSPSRPHHFYLSLSPNRKASAIMHERNLDFSLNIVFVQCGGGGGGLFSAEEEVPLIITRASSPYLFLCPSFNIGTEPQNPPPGSPSSRNEGEWLLLKPECSSDLAVLQSWKLSDQGFAA